MVQLTDLIDIVQSNPELAALVAAIFIVLGAVQYFLGPEDDWVENYREKYWFKLHELLEVMGGYAVVTKGPDDYVYSVKIGEERLEEILYKGKYHRNPISSKKLRLTPEGEEERSLNSWVHRETILADMQNHATNFPGHKDGEVDIYHHYETSWIKHPFEHYFNVKQIDGDPEGTLKQALEKSDVEYYRDEEWLNEFK